MGYVYAFSNESMPGLNLNLSINLQQNMKLTFYLKII